MLATMFPVATDSCANGHNNCTSAEGGGTCSLVKDGPGFKCGCRKGWVVIRNIECKRKLTPQKLNKYIIFQWYKECVNNNGTSINPTMYSQATSFNAHNLLLPLFKRKLIYYYTYKTNFSLKSLLPIIKQSVSFVLFTIMVFSINCFF